MIDLCLVRDLCLEKIRSCDDWDSNQGPSMFNGVNAPHNAGRRNNLVFENIIFYSVTTLEYFFELSPN